MDKDKSYTNSWKGTGISGNNHPQKDNNHLSVSDDSLNHSNLGEYNSVNRHVSGGHGQDSLDYMDKTGIEYEINIEYNNGVRVGNIPTSKQTFTRDGNNHTWFPKSWSKKDIKQAGMIVAKSFKGKRKNGVKHSKIVNHVRVTVMFNENGEIATIYPSKKQPGGKKNDK